MKINEASKLSGVTVRTLHYYDEINLLKPSKIADSGYRIYSEKDLEKLQQILFFRELEFSLANIKQIMSDENYDKIKALKNHKKLLKQKRDRLNTLIDLCEHTLKGKNDMSFKQFDMSEIENAKKQYAKEVKEKWGKTDAYAQSKAKTDKYTKADWQNISEEMAEIFGQFAELKKSGTTPENEKAQALVKTWQNHITDNFYTCTNEILQGLGEMYTADERFMNNVDKHGEGTAQFISQAIEVYCLNNG